MTSVPSSNIDHSTVAGFGEEWAAFDQQELQGEEYERLFNAYFGIFPFDDLEVVAEGFDLGCGSGRWALGVAPRVGRLHCIDPSAKALDVAKRRLAANKNIEFHQAAADTIPLPDGSQDFGYSLGVLHHVPDTQGALAVCAKKLKPGAPFLLYLYYKLDDRPAWFRALWRITDIARRGVCRMPFGLRKRITTAIAATVYWPLARGARVAERLSVRVEHWPLSSYRETSFYTMRTDALDRFGTRLEQRFSRAEIEKMMHVAGLEKVTFSTEPPYWVAIGRRSQ